MRDILSKMLETYNDIDSKQFDSIFKNYFDDSKYIIMFKKQFYAMYKNVLSIEALLKIGCIEDAFSIFRKYMESYINTMFVLVHPDHASRFLIHDKYLNMKSNGKYSREMKDFYKDKPDGFLSFGFIEDLVDTSNEDFKYGIYEVAKCAGIESYYEWYRISNNFVHNNTIGLLVDTEEGTKKLIELIKEANDNYVKKLKEIILKLTK